MSYDMASPDDRSAATEASRRKLDETLDAPFEPEDDNVRVLARWIVHVFTLFLSYIQLAFYDFDQRIQELEHTDEEDEPSPSHRPSAAKPFVSATATQPATSASVRLRRRCVKCHAKGHDESQCRTKDPAANRRRVAINQRRKKEAARNPPTYPFPADPRFYLYAQPSPAVIHPPAEYAAIVADASEFRRRNNQSTQDRRRARRSAAQPP